MCQTLDAGGSKGQEVQPCLEGHGLSTSIPAHGMGSSEGASRAARSPARRQGWVSPASGARKSAKCGPGGGVDKNKC